VADAGGALAIAIGRCCTNGPRPHLRPSAQRRGFVVGWIAWAYALARWAAPAARVRLRSGADLLDQGPSVEAEHEGAASAPSSRR